LALRVPVCTYIFVHVYACKYVCVYAGIRQRAGLFAYMADSMLSIQLKI
jgi:hypothetical protein